MISACEDVKVAAPLFGNESLDDAVDVGAVFGRDGGKRKYRKDLF